MDDGLTPDFLAHVHWSETEGSLPPTESERLKDLVLKRHNIPTVLRTVDGDDPAMSAEGTAELGGRAKIAMI